MIYEMSRKQKILGFIICLAPCLPLFWPHQIFSLDWLNHLWSIEYFSQYFSAQGRFPIMFDTNPVLGIPIPIFYAYHFYSISGWFSQFLGSGYFLILMLFGLYLLQFNLIYKTLTTYFAESRWAFSISLLSLWAIYPMTNIYHRGAITEFVGVSFLICSVCALLMLIRKHESSKAAVTDYIWPGFYYGLAAVSHSLTAIYGGGLLFILTLALLLTKKRIWLVIFSLGNAVALLGLLSPWLYAVFTLAKDFHFVKSNPLVVIPGIDSLWQRISPTAFEWRSTLEGAGDLITFPYVDTQMNTPVFLVASFLSYVIFKGRKENPLTDYGIVGWGCFFLSLLLIFVSSFQPLANIFNPLLGNMQFAYRLVNYINILALASIILWLGELFSVSLASPRLEKRFVPLFNQILLVAGVLSFCGLTSKMNHIYPIRAPSSLETVQKFMKKYTAPKEKPTEYWFPGYENVRGNAINLSPGYYGHPEYSLEKGFNQNLNAQEQLSSVKWVYLTAENGSNFGKVQEQEIQLAEQSIVVSNIQAFPWNRLVINGEVLDPSRTLVRSSLQSITEIKEHSATVGLSVSLAPGKYRIGYECTPDLIWKNLIKLSWAILIATTLILLVLHLKSYLLRTKNI